MVEHVSNRIQLLFIMSFDGILAVVCVVVSPACSDCDPVWFLSVDGVQFPS